MLGSKRPGTVGYKETSSEGEKHVIKIMSAGRGFFVVCFLSLKESLRLTNGQSRRCGALTAGVV